MRSTIGTAFLAIAAVLVLATAAGARPDVDPISGKWTGQLTPEDGEQIATVALDLKYDGKQDVTGTFTGLQSPGEVKKGTFDAKTNALHLLLGKSGEADVLLRLDGRVEGEVASGKFSGEKNGAFRLERQKTAR